MANIDAKKLIVDELRLRKQQLELAKDEVQNAIDLNDQELIPLKYAKAKEFNGMIQGLTYALRCILAQQTEASGRKVSADLSEFDKVIEGMIDGKD